MTTTASAPAQPGSREPATAKPSVALYFAYADGLRALGVLYVFGYHLMFVTAPELPHHVQIADLLIAFDPVVMFFILSSYLLAGPYIKAYLRDGSDFPLTSGYAAARALRAFPPYYTGIVLIGIYLWAVHTPATWWDFVSHAIFVEGFSPATAQTLSGPLWTLAVDLQFYIVLPMLFWVLFSRTRTLPYPRRVAVLFWTLGAIALASIAYRWAAMAIVKPVTWEEEIVWLHQLPGSTAVLAMGMAARALLEVSTPATRAWMSRNTWTMIAGALALRPFGWLYEVHYDQLKALHAGPVHFGNFLVAMQDPISAVAAIAILLALVAGSHNPISRVLATRPVAFASSISLGIYMYHMTVITTLVGPHPVPSWPLFFKTLFLSTAILVPLCWFMHRFVEVPFLSIKANLKRAKSTHVVDLADVEKAGATLVDPRLFPATSEQA
jgi:peptidoglycan/LPS O-acetylase OafA/YrhL